MTRVRMVWLGLVMVLAVLAVFALPGVAAAGFYDTNLYAYQDESQTPEEPDRPILAVPGYFSLSLGRGFTVEDGTWRLATSEIDLPALNATATINGLSLGFGDGSYGWDSIFVEQVEPVGSESFTVSGLQANIHGPDTNYSTEAGARVDVHPSEAIQAGANLALERDGLTGASSVAVSDGAAAITAGPVSVAVDGVNAGDGAVSIASAAVGAPEAGVFLMLDGYQVADGQADWDALTLFGSQLNLGQVASLSEMQVVVPGPSARSSEPLVASTLFEVNGGDLAQADGQVIFAVDPSTGWTSLAVQDANVMLGPPGWNLDFIGINAGSEGAVVDGVVLVAEPLGVEAQVTDLTVGGSQGLTFGQARFAYRPAASASGQASAGFEMVVDSTDAGYVVTTTTVVPMAKSP